MARKYLDFKAFDKQINTLFKKHGKEALVDEYFSQRKADPVFAMASRLVRMHADKFTKFVGWLNESLPDSLKNQSMLSKCPLIIPGPTDDTLRVFPNIILDATDREALEYVSWAMHWDVLDSFYKNYLEEKKDDRKSKAWETTSRAWRRLKRYEDMPISRVLARYTALEKQPASIVAAVATGILEFRKPIEIIFANTPEAFIDMYGSGPQSCMSKDGRQADRSWSFLIDELKTHPTAFYAFHPHTKGAYIKAGGKVAARAICYEVKDGVWEYGRLYSANEKYTSLFTNALKEQGITSLKDSFDRECEFEIPGYKWGSEYVMPLPYFDNMARGFHVKFDDDKKSFLIAYSSNRNKAPNSSSFAEAGLIRSSRMVRVKCACGREHLPGRSILAASHDGLYKFCGPACMDGAGYCNAYRSDGGIIIISKAEAIQDAVKSSTFFLNEDAAKKLNALPLLMSFDDIPEDGDSGITINYKNIIRIKDTMYGWYGPASQFSKLWDKRYENGVTKLSYHGENIGGINVYELYVHDAQALKVHIKKQKTVFIEDNETLVAA